MSKSLVNGTKILAHLSRDAGVWAYQTVALLGAALIWRRKKRLAKSGNHDCELDAARWKIRYTDETQSAPEQKTGPRVAMVATAWGDVKTIEPLSRALKEARPDTILSFTVKHREAIALADELGDEAPLPLPFDHPIAVARWLERARPDLVVFYEKFAHPTLLRALWHARVPFVVVHARMWRAGKRSKLGARYKAWQLRGARAITLSTGDSLESLRQMAPDGASLNVVGSLKFLHQRPQLAPDKAADLRAWIEAGAAGAPIVAAGSTHETEEEWIFDALELTRAADAATSPAMSPVLLLAPRKLGRMDEVEQLARARGLRVSRRSQSAPGAPVDVLLLDTLGELMVAYGYALGAFVGGTLVGSAHNVAEPLVWSMPVFYGPRRGNFAFEQSLCEAAGVGFRVETPAELAEHWARLIESPALRDELAIKSQSLLAQQSLAFERTLEVVLEALDGASA